MQLVEYRFYSQTIFSTDDSILFTAKNWTKINGQDHFVSNEV